MPLCTDKKLQDKSKEIHFFNKITEHQDYEMITSYGLRSILKSFIKQLTLPLGPSTSVLDLGCGTGAFTREFINNQDARVYGMDISINAIRRARNNKIKTSIRYQVGDINKLPFKNNVFDVVLYSGVLHHFPQMQPCLKEGLRVLKKGGTLLSYDPHINNPGMWLYRHPSSPFYSNIGITENEYLLSKKQMDLNLSAAGFKNIQLQSISGVTFRAIASPFGEKFLPMYNLFETALGLTPLEKIFGSFLICCARK